MAQFNNLSERKKALLDFVELGVISLKCAETLMESGFLTAPASTKYHGNYAGGLFDHSYNVAVTLQSMTEKLSLQWENEYSPLRIGLLHDLCKIDSYVYDVENLRYIHDTETLLKEHGMKSIVLSQQLPDIKLTEEEIACIAYHMGAFTDKSQWKDYTNAIHRYPNVLWTHTADCYAAHVMEVKR